jgi:hypothetical protein
LTFLSGAREIISLSLSPVNGFSDEFFGILIILEKVVCPAISKSEILTCGCNALWERGMKNPKYFFSTLWKRG